MAEIDPRLAKRQDWSSGVVRPSGRRDMLGWTIFTLLWNSVALVMAYKMLYGHSKGGSHHRPPPDELVYAFLGIGALAFFGTMYGWFVVLKWSRSVLRLTSFPPRLGESLRGQIETGRSLLSSRPLRAHLICVRISRDDGGDSTQIRRDNIWEQESFIDSSTPCLRDGAIPIGLQLPQNGRVFMAGKTEWQLIVSGKICGTNLRLRFDLPVLEATDELNDNIATNAGDPKQYDFEQSLAWHEPAISVTELVGSTRIVFPAARHVGFSLMWAGIGLALLIGAALLWNTHAWLILPITFGLFGLMLLPIGLSLLLKHRKILVAASGIEYESRVLFFTQHRLFTPDQISKIVLRRSGSAGNHTYYRLVLHTMLGKQVVLGELIRSKIVADTLLGRIKATLKLA